MYEELSEESISEEGSGDMEEDMQVLDNMRNKVKQSKQGFKSLVSRKRVTSWDMDEIFLM